MHTGFSSGNLRERDPLKELGLDLRTVLKCIFKTLDGGMKWINLANWSYLVIYIS